MDKVDVNSKLSVDDQLKQCEEVKKKVGIFKRVVLYVSVFFANCGKTIKANGGMTLGSHTFSAEFGSQMNGVGEDMDSILSLSARAFDLFLLQKKITLVKQKILDQKDNEQLKAELKELQHERVFKTLQELVGGVKFFLQKGGYQLLKISNKAIEGVKGWRGMGVAGKISTSLTSAKLGLLIYSTLRSTLLLVRNRMIPHYQEINKLVQLGDKASEKDKMRLQFLKNVGTMAIVKDTFRQALKVGSTSFRIAGFVAAVLAGVTMTAVSLSALPFAIMALTLVIELAMYHLDIKSSFGMLEDLKDYATILSLGSMTISSPLSVVAFALVGVGILFDLYQAIKANPQALKEYFYIFRAKGDERTKLQEAMNNKKMVRSLGFDSVDAMKQATDKFNIQEISKIYGKKQKELEFLKAV